VKEYQHATGSATTFSCGSGVRGVPDPASSLHPHAELMAAWWMDGGDEPRAKTFEVVGCDQVPCGAPHESGGPNEGA
jgi:hypothetical protein